MEEGVLMFEVLVVGYFDCIVLIDKSGLGINSVLFVNFNVFEEVRVFDVKWVCGEIFGFLYGFVVLFKDNIELKELFMMVGLVVLLKNEMFWDFLLVENLCNVGVVILGKINLLEWVNFCFE